MNKLRVRLFASNAVAILVAVIGVGFGVGTAVHAFSSPDSPKVVVEGNYIEAVQPLPPEEEKLGAVASATEMGPEICISDFCTYAVTANNISASTTIFSTPIPYLAATSSAKDVIVKWVEADKFGYTGASSTLSKVKICSYPGRVATTTITIGCATSATPSAPTSTGSMTFLTMDTLITSTPFCVENDIAAAAGGKDTASVEKIQMGASMPYLVCRVWTESSLGDEAFTNPYIGYGPKFHISAIFEKPRF